MGSLRHAAVAVSLLTAGCGGQIVDDEGSSWDEDWNDTPPVTVCRTGAADHQTLGEAVAQSVTGSVIDVCTGFYGESVLIDGKKLWLRGAGAEGTVIDAGGLGPVLTVSGGAAVRVDGITLQHGGGVARGGGVACSGASVRLVDAAVRDSSAADTGGGLDGAACVLLIERTAFTGNAADEGGGLAVDGGELVMTDAVLTGNEGRVRGGGAYLGGAALDAVIEGSTFSGNRAGWTGGGIHVHEAAPILRRNVIGENDAVEEGGGIYLHHSAALLEGNHVVDNHSVDDGGGVRLFESRARLIGNLIARNVSDADGGGVKVSHLPSELIDNQIIDNRAAWTGGGIEMDNDSSVVRGGVVSGNHTDGRGGGIHIQLWPWNGGLIDGVVISGNHANDGGGLYIDRNFQLVTLRGLTITDNRANQGGGLYVQGAPLAFTNSLLRGNQASHEGGAIFAGLPPPWTEPCPCPPEDPPMSVEFVVLHGNRGEPGAAVYSEARSLAIESSIVSENQGTAVAVAQQAPPPGWRWNDTWPAGFAGMGDPSGRDGNLALAPAFRDPAAGDFRLLDGSPCIDAGDPAAADRDGTRADMGLFAGPNAP